MNLSWVAIYDKGGNDERLHFRATANVDLSHYAVFDTVSLTPETIRPYQRTCFWFVSKKIKAGDNVVLYTRAVSPSTETRLDGSLYHFLFRGLSAPLYTAPNTRAVLFELNTWSSRG